MELNIKGILKKTAALMLSCLMVYGSFAVFASALADGSLSVSPPAYMKALSELVKSTADENAFGRIELAVGNPEMSIDGSTQQISPDENQTPVIKDGEVLIPEEALNIGSDNATKGGTESAAEVPDADNALLTVEELEARGYEVTCDSSSGMVIITEPFQSMRLIVKTKTGDISNTYGATTEIKVSNNKIVLQYASKDAAKNASEKISADASVIFCEQDSLCTIQDTADGESTGSYINWGTTRVGADEYMNTLPDASALSEVVVAVVDTGIDVDHPFFSGRIKAGGWDFVNNDSDPDDDNSHGSHCSGIITDATKSNVKILPIKVMNAKGSGSTSVIVEGMMYAVDSGADIISMSLGGGGDKRLYQDAITYARSKNVPCVVSAGNDRLDLNIFSIYPARIPEAITVSSSNERDCLSTFSNYGEVIDLCAPGENILSAVLGGKFGLKSGTSMSTPLVAACTALLKSTDMNLTPDEVCEALCEKASDRGIPGRDDYFGAGVLSLKAFQRIHSMSFETSSITLETYDYEDVCLSFYPEYPSDNTVTYTCSNEEVAFVNSFGRVTGLKAGTAVITAVSTQGGFTDTLKVTVKEGASGSFSTITAGGDGILFLKNNQTGYGYGYGPAHQFGYYSASRYNYLIPFCKDPKTMITDIKNIFANPLCTFYTKTDGTFWTVGIISQSTWEVYSKPVKIMIDGNTPLTDIVQADYMTALRDDGTVWVPGIENPALFRQLMTEDGLPLSGVKMIHSGQNGVAVMYDGSVYEWWWGQNYMGEPVAKRIKNDDGTLMSDVVDAYIDSDCYVILKKNGTVWAKGNNTSNFLGTPELDSSDEFIQIKTAENEYLTDVTDIAYNGNGTYALKRDGTVWSWGGFYSNLGGSGWLGIGSYNNEKIYATQVKTVADTPLTHVAKFVEMNAARMIFVRDDGSVWWAGVIDQDYYSAPPLFLDCNFYAEPMVIMGNQQVYVKKDDTIETYVNRNVTAVQLDKTVMSIKKGESISLSASVLPLDAQNRNICWVSDNPEVASVSGSGVVTAKTSGTTVIRAMSYEDREIFAECRVTVEDENPMKIVLKKLPDKLTYLTGETLDTDGGVICLTYTNGQVNSLPLAASFCSGYDMNTAGNQRVTVNYAGLAVYYDITINSAPTVTSVDLKRQPDKTDYIKGEKLDTKGGVLTVLYSDGTSKDVDITSCMCSGYDPQTTGNQTVFVSYSDKSCTYGVSVRNYAVTGIVITAYPDKTAYYVFDSLITDGGTIALRYEDGKLGANIPISADVCSGYDMSKVGPQTVTVTYNGHSTSFTIEIYNSGDAAYITMNTQPDQIYYYYKYDTTLNVTGGSITVHYKDGNTEIVTMINSMCSGYKVIGVIPDPQVVTVTYYGMTTTFQIRNIKKINSELVSIKVTKLPDKLDYVCGESIDTTGGKVRLEYQNSLLIETDMRPFVQSGYEKTTPGQSQITVEYGVRSDSFYVNYTEGEEVEDKVIDVYWGGTPQKTVYYLGDDLIVSDAYIWVVTQSGTDIDTNYVDLTEDMCSGYDLSKTGEQTVTVTYEAVTLTFKIWVSDLILENELPTINIGKSTRVAAYFSPKTGALKTLSWSSSNPSVATVDKYGLVTGKAEGSTDITAQVAGAVLATSCTVTVTKEDICVTSVHLSDTTKTLNLESRTQLTATVEPGDAANKNVAWSSSDEDVAMVDENGLVTAVGTGTAEITVKTQEGGYTASCTVTVAGSLDVRVTGISLNKNKLELSYKTSEQLVADVQPSNASDKSVIWSSSNGEVASVDQNGIVTGVSRGIATITARTADGDFVAICEVEVKLQWWQWLLWVLMFGFLWY